MAIASNFSEHIEEGHDITSYYIHIPLHIIIPLLMLVITLIRNRFKKKAN
jgi:spore germination protein KB